MSCAPGSGSSDDQASLVFSLDGGSRCVAMKKICLILAITFCSWLGWRLGESYGIMTAYWLSFAGSLIGVLLGCFFNRRYLD